jgi:hypothetical protein
LPSNMCFVLVTFHKLANFSKKQELKVFTYVVIINTNNIFIQFLQWNWHIFVYLVITMLKFKILSILLVHSLVQFHHFNHINDNFMPQKKTLFSYCTKDKTFIFSNFYCFLFLIQKIWKKLYDDVVIQLREKHEKEINFLFISRLKNLIFNLLSKSMCFI